MNTPLISIIVPVFKAENYLDKCVSSIVNQTYKNLEIILVDNGSPDSCPEMCDEWKLRDSRIVVIHKESGCASSSRNAGLDVAKGDWIGFVDSDDYIENTMYEKMYKAIYDNNAELCICGVNWIEEDGSKYEYIYPSDIADEVLSKGQVFQKLVSNSNAYYTMVFNKLYKKEIFENIRFPLNRSYSEEFIVHHVFNACDKVVCVKDELYYYIQRFGGVVTAPYRINRLDVVDAMRDRYLLLEQSGLHLVLNLCSEQLHKTLLYNINNANVFKFRKKFWKVICKSKRFFTRKQFRNVLSSFIKKNVVDSLWGGVLYKPLLPSLEDLKNGRIIIMATPEHGNLGDHAIVYSEIKFLKENFENKKIIEIPNGVYLQFADSVRRCISKKDIIIIDGGGSLGTLWPNEDDKISNIIWQFKNNKTIVFPQTCYYDDTIESKKRLEKNQKIYSKANDLIIMLRDKDSYDFAQKNFPGTNLFFVPDIVLSVSPEVEKKDRRGVLLCFRSDLEKVINDSTINNIKTKLNNLNKSYKITTTVIHKRVNLKTRECELQKKWTEFASAELVITDRLHAMIFAAITKTPCIAVNNKSKKVSGTYNWISELPYVCCLDDEELICENIEKYVDCNGMEYSFEYPTEKLINVLKNK